MSKSADVKRLILLISIFSSLFFKGHGQAQLPPAISQYMFNPMSCNPAYAGFYDMAIGSNLFKSQISGFNMFTNALNFHTSLPVDKMGAGINLTYDQVGITQAINVDFVFSYKLVFGANKLSFGAQGSVFNGKNNFDLLKYDVDGISTNDDIYKYEFIPESQSSITKPNFGLGFLYSGRKFFGGISVPRLFSMVDNAQFVNNQSSSSNYSTRYQPYFTASFGKIIHIKNRYELKPSFMTKYITEVGLLADLNASLLFKKVLWAGISIRNSIQNPEENSGQIFSAFNSIGLMAQLQASSKLKVGFSYDFLLSNQTLRSQRGYGAPFEIMAAYNFAIFEEQGVHTFLY